jgi:hypothetical protein
MSTAGRTESTQALVDLDQQELRNVCSLLNILGRPCG